MPKWSRPQAPQPNWFAIATAITAAVVVFCGGGLGGSEPVGGQTEPLTLALSAPQICETTPSVEGVGGRTDAHGRSETYTIGWRLPGEVEVAWAVNSGSGPYTLTIDGETRDSLGAFEGAKGTGWVSCALTHGEAFFRDPGGGYVVTNIAEAPRYFHEKPEVDSGLKTIAATVTDATGATAEASVDVYVILELGSAGDRLEAGKTYRVFDQLVTVPEEIDLEINGIELAIGGASSLSFNVVGSLAQIALDLDFPGEVSRYVPDAPHVGPAGQEIDLHAKFDELVALHGQPPIAPIPQR